MGKSLAALWQQASEEFRRQPELIGNRYAELLRQHGYRPIDPAGESASETPQKATVDPLRGVAGDDTFEPPERLEGR